MEYIKMYVDVEKRYVEGSWEAMYTTEYTYDWVRWPLMENFNAWKWNAYKRYTSKIPENNEEAPPEQMLNRVMVTYETNTTSRDTYPKSGECILLPYHYHKFNNPVWWWMMRNTHTMR